MTLRPTIGLEVHVELATKSKMFCGCPADHFAKKPNTQTCPICLGLPGSLPVPNERAIEWTAMIGLALGSSVNTKSKFDRKHYTYPDLPKGYQISQYDEPICEGGEVETSHGKIGITRVHLEEDTGKLVHRKVKGNSVTLVDFNRSGVALVEIVTEPDIHSAAQAKEFTKGLQQLIRSLGVSDCDMEKGSMRLEANISQGLELGYKVEIKNLNSFKFMEKAVSYELERQEKMLASGKTPIQETRGWDESAKATIAQRRKETSEDYRYFPEPDIPALSFTKEYVRKISSKIPELPKDTEGRLMRFGVRKSFAGLIARDRASAEFVSEAILLGKKVGIEPNAIASAVTNKKVIVSSSTPRQFIEGLKSTEADKVGDSSSLSAWAESAIKGNKEAVTDYKGGKLGAISVLIGAVMKESKGKADAFKVKKILESLLS